MFPMTKPITLSLPPSTEYGCERIHDLRHRVMRYKQDMSGTGRVSRAPEAQTTLPLRRTH
jgi:hypothetical protein